MVYKYATILGDGTFVEGQPNGGLDGFDRAGELRANPVGWGSWAMTGASGRVEFPAVPGVPGGAITWEMSLRGDVLWLGTRSYRKLDPGDGLTLNGTFMRADRNEFARQTITFTPDGRFTDQGVFRAASVTHRTPRNPFEDDDGRAGSGTYVIGNYTLRLRFSDGRVKQSFFFVPDGQARGDVRTISINTYDFARIP
jgi:hypothetical protein